MRMLVIPDVHLRDWMFDDADKLLKDGVADGAVFLGDIVDDWGQETNIAQYKKTLDRALKFQKDYPDTLWCKGNHDMAYLWSVPCSGTSRVLATQDAAISGLCDLYYDSTKDDDKPIDKKTAAFVHKVDNVLFSHAGISRIFALENTETDKAYNDVDFVLDMINAMDENKLWNDDSPIWLRPQNHYAGYTLDMYKPRTFLQVVGHSPMKEITKEKSLISCDVFSTYRNGFPYGNEEFCIVDTVKKTWESVPSSKKSMLRMWGLLSDTRSPEETYLQNEADE